MKKVKYLPLVLLLLVLLIPTAFAYYYDNDDSKVTTTFDLDYESVFVRASILTHWVSLESGEIVAKTGWNLKDGVTSNLWTKIDDYYYYNGIITNEVFESTGLNGLELIDPNSDINSLSNENLKHLKYQAKYEIVYEVIEVDVLNDVLSCEDAWGITYSSEGIPSKIS